MHQAILAVCLSIKYE